MPFMSLNFNVSLQELFSNLQCSSVPVNQRIYLVCLPGPGVDLVDNGYPIDFGKKYQQCSTISALEHVSDKKKMTFIFWTTQWTIIACRELQQIPRNYWAALLFSSSLHQTPNSFPEDQLPILPEHDVKYGYSCVSGSNSGYIEPGVDCPSG